MALTITKTISVNGTSTIEGVQVVYMSASISTLGESTSVNTLIQDKDMYNANKSAVRADINAFQDAVYEIEDAFMTREAQELLAK